MAKLIISTITILHLVNNAKTANIKITQLKNFDDSKRVILKIEVNKIWLILNEETC